MKTKLGLIGITGLLVLMMVVIPVGAVTVRLGVQSSQWADVLSTFFEEFTAETGIKVEMESISFGVMYEKLKTGFVAGMLPYDMLWYDSMWTPEFSASGWLRNLDEFLSDSTLTPVDWGYPDDFFGVEYSGKYEAGNKWGLPKGVWGIPLIAGFRPLYYRTDLLEEAGLVDGEGNPRPPKTLWELLGYARLLNDPENDLYGFVMPAKRPRICYDWSGYLWTMGGDFFDENLKPIFNSPEGVAALKLYIELGKVAPPGVAAYHITECWEAYMEGRAALAWTWQDLASVAREKSAIIGKFACAIPPAGPTGETHPLVGGIVASIPSSAAHPKEAWQLLTWLLAPGERSVEATLKGATLQRRSVWDDPRVEEMYPSGVDDIEDACQDLGRPVPFLPEWAAIDQIIAEQLSAAFAGLKSPEAALDEAAARVEELMREAGYYK
ncbi:MAG: ABC transporter substrate-binding protein [Candidatus Freyarchaeota archaeon]